VISGTLVVVDEGLSQKATTVVKLTLSLREGATWRPACVGLATFSPRFDTRRFANDWAKLGNWPRNECAGAVCVEMQRGALALARMAQSDYLHAERRAARMLTVAQRAEFARLKGVIDSDQLPGIGRNLGDDESVGPQDLTEGRPLILPLVAGGRVHLASIGHFTIGWRVFQDWKIVVHRVDANGPRVIANFAIGMSNGRMTKLVVN
jgi:hypothetical protein